MDATQTTTTSTASTGAGSGLSAKPQADLLSCAADPRRDAVRRHAGRNGLDYIEMAGDIECGDADDPTGEAGRTLHVYFLGKLPPELATNRPGLERYFQITGGERITGLRIVDVDPQVQEDPERDDYLVVRLDRDGDFSRYTLQLVGVEGIDPRYDRADFSFSRCCPAPIDCQPACDCEPPVVEEPPANYLAKDYSSFLQLIYDRLAVLMPGWTERHAPDLGVTLAELLAYTGDLLSYQQDAVATEAYLGTARQRISVRRHARLVDYRLHEGCNARAWVALEVSAPLTLPSDHVAFVTDVGGPEGPGRPPLPATGPLAWQDVVALPASSYEWFEPLPSRPARDIALRPAHNLIRLYTWGGRECCLGRGATSATLLDEWVVNDSAPQRALNVSIGDVLIFEEVLGARTGLPADADPRQRWAVRLTGVRLAEDTLYTVPMADGDTTPQRGRELATPLVEVSWTSADALPFSFCLSTVGNAPDCAYLTDVTVARGNVVAVDHGRTLPPEPLGNVPGITSPPCCECEGEPGDVRTQPARWRPTLAQAPLVFSEASVAKPASLSLVQDPRAAVPALALQDDAGAAWTAQPDLIESHGDDRHFVAEVDNEGIAHLRFGDGELGRQPDVGRAFTATYRIGGADVGNLAGNVGAESITRLVLNNLTLGGVDITVRNPLPAQGGIAPEPIEEARLFAPGAFRRPIERAIIAADYAAIAARDARLQRAAATLAWTGSWYEADVAVDPLGTEQADAGLLKSVAHHLYRYRRIGHDLRVERAVYVPLKLGLQVCALPGYDAGHVRAALLQRFSTRRLPGGQRGFFHPDELSFGQAVFLSRIVAAAQAVAGVECVTVTEFHRLFAAPNQEIANGLLPLAAREIAQLDNDPDHPERGQLDIVVRQPGASS